LTLPLRKSIFPDFDQENKSKGDARKMPILKSPAKRMRSDAKKKLLNLESKTRLKTLYKNLTLLVKEKSKDAEKKVRELSSQLDKAASRGIIKKNTASRKKARIAKLFAKSSKKKS
jgi:small subunit ribosomal protein S20